MSQSLSLFALLDMAPPSPSELDDSESTGAGSPVAVDAHARDACDARDARDARDALAAAQPLALEPSAPAAAQHSALFRLPDDVFKCVLDYLDRDAAWSLKRVCRGMAASASVTQLLYRYPLQLDDVRDVRLAEWKYRATGQLRWQAFQASIHDGNRAYVHKLALSHWASLDDFRWIAASLPALASLDLSPIKDFVWTPEETWTWRMLADACPALFARLDELAVANWADYTAHARIEYSYSYNDYRYTQRFRLSRRRDGGSVARHILPLCRRLTTLAIRERYSGFHTWNEWEVHQRVCCLVDGVQAHAPPTLTRLKVHDYAPYRSLFSTDATDWPRITHVELGLHTWMEDRRERDVIGPIPYRITQGHHHRDEEDAFDDKSLDTCKRDHMALGAHVVQGVGASFEDLLQSLQAISRKHPTIRFTPTRTLQDITLHPFHLVNVMQRRPHFGHLNPQQNPQITPLPPPLLDPCSNIEVQDAIRWLLNTCDWKPILAWDSMMCDVFPANLEPNRTFLPRADVVSRIQTMIATLRTLNIPIRISIGDRTTNTSPTSGLDAALYFGDYKTFTGTGDDKQELLLPTQACFNLTPIAHMVDELTIQYPINVPGVSTLRARRRQSPAERLLLDRELTGWRRFWTRYATQFTNLKKLTANVPNDIYDDWAKTDLPTLLTDRRWEMLEVPENDGDYGFFGSYFPFSSFRYSFMRKRTRRRFVQRVFFRRDDAPLAFPNPHPHLTDVEREERPIPADEIADRDHSRHPFWTQRRNDRAQAKPGHHGKKKRKLDRGGPDDDSAASGSKKQKNDIPST